MCTHSYGAHVAKKKEKIVVFKRKLSHWKESITEIVNIVTSDFYLWIVNNFNIDIIYFYYKISVQ